MRDNNIAWKKLASRYDRRYEKILENEIFFSTLFMSTFFNVKNKIFGRRNLASPKLASSKFGAFEIWRL